MNSKSEQASDAAIEALRTIDGDKAFDLLWQHFRGEVRKKERPFRSSKALEQMDPRLFEGRILQVIKSGRESLTTIENMLWCLVWLATAKSAEVVWPFLSRRETYMEAVNILGQAEVFPAISGRVESLGSSTNELERVAHIYLSVPNLEVDGIHSLADHEKDESPLVRSAVVEMYSAAKSSYSESRLGEMVLDKDTEVQRDVVLALLSQAKEWLDRCTVVSEGRLMQLADVLTHPVGVMAVQQRDVLERLEIKGNGHAPMMIPTGSIRLARPTELPGVGQAIVLTQQSGSSETFTVLIPREDSPYHKGQQIKNWLFRLATTISPSVVSFEVDKSPAQAVVELGERARPIGT